MPQQVQASWLWQAGASGRLLHLSFPSWSVTKVLQPRSTQRVSAYAHGGVVRIYALKIERSSDTMLSRGDSVLCKQEALSTQMHWPGRQEKARKLLNFNFLFGQRSKLQVSVELISGGDHNRVPESQKSSSMDRMGGGSATTTPTVLFDSFNGDGGNTEAGFGDEEDDDDD
ncbi:hypothetical protein UY3_00870 [Chelonia mydas]|uniref:Uncharacterized protein n=1 Tax=Chelonia mydas TaxID=8469 RepID=M7C131_CHEMY|nr:hypothetical protein UY3_00870 [Chelonia mydas]